VYSPVKIRNNPDKIAKVVITYVIEFYKITYSDREVIWVLCVQDLVAWVTLGMLHIPHTGDLPVVNTQNTRLRFHILPYNYFSEDPSLASRDNIRVESGHRYDRPSDVEWQGHNYQFAGVDSHVGCTPRSGAARLLLAPSAVTVSVCLSIAVSLSQLLKLV
jgi:hypothetical protein